MLTRSRRALRAPRTTTVGALAAVALVAGCGLLPPDGPDRDSTGAVTAEAETDAFSVAVGDCVDDPGTETVSDITVVPCGELHDFEAIAGTRMPDGDFPGDGATSAAATDFCGAEFESFVGLDYDSSVLDILYFYPTEDSWNTADDREILCFVAEADGTPVTGSLRGANR